MKSITIAIAGDFNAQKHTHVALNEAVKHASLHLPFSLHTTWMATDELKPESLLAYQGLWIAPGSPYQNDTAVYSVIQWARENNFPILGTCGGFQYMIVEYARHVAGIKNADHEESTPHGESLVVSKLSCSLKGKQETVIIEDVTSWLYHVLQQKQITGFFNCSYGVNPVYQNEINVYPFVFIAFSKTGEARAFELKRHRFFKGTLFQPPLDSTSERPNPLLMDFFKQLV